MCTARYKVKAGDPLFALDSTAEKARPGRSGTPGFAGERKPRGCKKGKRPSEIESLKAQIKQAQAALVFRKKNSPGSSICLPAEPLQPRPGSSAVDK